MAETATDSDLRVIQNADEIDLLELAGRIWAGRWIVAGVTLLLVVLTALYLHLATYRYTATLKLTPAQSSSMGLASRIGGLGSMASLAGISLPQDSGTLDFSLFADSIHSRQLAEKLAQNPTLMQAIFRSEWDEAGKVWRQPESAVSGIINPVKRLLGIPVYPWTAPNSAQLQDYLTHSVKLVESNDKPFITLSMEHENPEFASRFLDLLAENLNGILRDKTLRRTTDNIAYLSQQLDRVTIVEHRLAIVQALSEQERRRMLASSSAPYAADPLGSASASARPTSPKPVILLFMAVVGGVIAGSALVLVLGWARDLTVDRQTPASGDLPAPAGQPAMSAPGQSAGPQM